MIFLIKVGFAMVIALITLIIGFEVFCFTQEIKYEKYKNKPMYVEFRKRKNL